MDTFQFLRLGLVRCSNFLQVVKLEQRFAHLIVLFYRLTSEFQCLLSQQLEFATIQVSSSSYLSLPTSGKVASRVEVLFPWCRFIWKRLHLAFCIHSPYCSVAVETTLNYDQALGRNYTRMVVFSPLVLYLTIHCLVTNVLERDLNISRLIFDYRESQLHVLINQDQSFIIKHFVQIHRCMTSLDFISVNEMFSVTCFVVQSILSYLQMEAAKL